MPVLEPPLSWTIDPPHGQGSRMYKFAASPAELASLKIYAGVDRVTDFVAEAEVSALSKGRFRVRGFIASDFVQLSVVNLDEIAKTLREDFSVEYWPKDQIEAANLASAEHEAEALTEEKIAFGALVSELFSVSIDPYPRLPGEEFAEIAEETSVDEKPFAKLATLTNLKPPKK